MPAAAIGGGDDAVGPLQQHGGSGALGGGGGGLQGREAGQIWEEPVKLGAMGGQPGRTLALAQPLARSSSLVLVQIRQPVEAIGIEQQEPRETLQLIPQLLMVLLAWVCQSLVRGSQTRSNNHRIKSLQGPGQLQGGGIEHHHMGLAGTKPRRSNLGHQGLEAAAAAGASPLQAELGGARIARAPGHNQQASATIFAGGRI